MNIHQVNVEIPCQIGYDRVDVGLLNRPHDDCTHPVGDGSKPSKKEQNDLDLGFITAQLWDMSASCLILTCDPCDPLIHAPSFKLGCPCQVFKRPVRTKGRRHCRLLWPVRLTVLEKICTCGFRWRVLAWRKSKGPDPWHQNPQEPKGSTGGFHSFPSASGIPALQQHHFIFLHPHGDSQGSSLESLVAVTNDC